MDQLNKPDVYNSINSSAVKHVEVLADGKVSVSRQSTFEAMKTNHVPDCSRSRDAITALYSALARACLEYCVQSWSPHTSRMTPKNWIGSSKGPPG